MAGADFRNLETYRTPKARLRGAFWASLSVLVSCALSWDLAAYSISFRESGRASALITAALLALALAWTLRLSMRARQHWWPVIPALVAVGAPIALHLMDHPVQPNGRLLSYASESTPGRASLSTPEPGR